MTPRWLLLMLNELRIRLRDRTLLLIAIVAPVIFATITSFAFSVFDSSQPVRLVVTDQSADPGHDSLLRALQASPQLRKVAVVDIVSSPAAARDSILHGTADAGLILPARASLDPGGVPQVGGVAEILESQSKPIGAAVAEAVVQTIGGQQWFDHVVLTALGEGAGGAGAGGAGVAVTTSSSPVPRDPVSLTDIAASSRKLTAATYYGSSMAILFLLFTVLPVAKSLWTERQNKTLDRLVSASTGRWAIIVGKALAAQVTGMASMLTVWAVTTVFFHANWGDPLGVVLLITVMVSAAVALAFAIASLVRTEQSLDGLAAAVTFILILIGGNFVPPASLPGGLRQASLFTPNGWALRGFLDLATGADAVATVTTPLLVLLAFTAGVWLLTTTRMKALVTP